MACPPLMQYAIDHAAGIVRLTMQGDVDGALYVTTLRTLLDSDDRLHGYDFLYDLREYSGSVGHDDVRVLADRYAPLLAALPRVSQAVLVSPDQGFRFWITLLNQQFSNREFHLAPSMAAGEALLAELRARRG